MKAKRFVWDVSDDPSFTVMASPPLKPGFVIANMTECTLGRVRLQQLSECVRNDEKHTQEPNPGEAQDGARRVSTPLCGKEQ